MDKQQITFKDLSPFLKTVIVGSCIYLIFMVIMFLIGFTIGVIETMFGV